MSNTAYPKGAEKILSGAIDFSTAPIKVALVSDAYTYSAAHEFLSSITGRVGIDQDLTNQSIVGGVFDGDDLDFGMLAPGSVIRAVVIYAATGNASTSPLLYHFDTVAGLPMSTNGGGLTVPWDDGPKKIARLGVPFYPLGATKQFCGAINLSTDTIKAALLPAGYVYSEAHEFLADVGEVIGTAQTLTAKSITGGVFAAANLDYGSVAAGSTVGSIALYKDTGNAASSPLLMHITDVTGFPMNTNGGGLQVQWSTGAAKIVKLTA